MDPVHKNNQPNAPAEDGVSSPRPKPSKRLKREEFPDPAEKFGGLPNTLDNVEHLLLAYNIDARWDVMKKRLCLARDGKPISEAALTSLGNLNGLRGLDFWTFVYHIANETPQNVIRDWINSVPWDGVDRLPEIIATVTPAEDYPLGLADMLLRRWLSGLVAAAMIAGGVSRFSMRGVLTLQGPQSIGKTSWFASLLPPGELRNQYFKRDHHMDGANKDAILGAIDHWLVELGELDGSFRRDLPRLKGFITNDCDKVRVPYGRKREEFPRTTVFGATVNDPRFLIDNTGNSRFLTISVVELDYFHQVNLQQLYAQLAGMGEQWWLTREEEARLADYNRRHVAVSVFAEMLHEYVDHDAIARGEGPYLSASEVVRKIGTDRPTNPQCKEMGAALRNLIGDPKRVNGGDKWRVPPKLPDYFKAQVDDVKDEI